MREIDTETAADYLRESGRVPPGNAIAVRALGWGVSNIVLRVDVEGQGPIVLKQSRERLRTEALWVSRLDRIWTEKAALELLATILPAGTVPNVLFDDPENYLFAITSSPDDAVVWKEQLLDGSADPDTSRLAGTILGAIHAETVGHPGLSGRLADTIVFDQLRIDPFYRTIARVHPDLAPRIDALIDSMAAERTFVHADFSPKNILVHSQRLTVVDFETAHAGDPAFDLGFFVSHLLLKAFRDAPHEGPALDRIRLFLTSYRARTGIDLYDDRLRRGIAHAAACALARVDGKSPVDYLNNEQQVAIRRFARAALRRLPKDGDELIGLAAREMPIKS